MIHWNYQEIAPIEPMRVSFKTLLDQNEMQIRTQMQWQNYEMNETVIPVIELLRDHALMVLSKSYGKFMVEPDILDELMSDIFIYFPVLMQELSITRLIDAYAVNTHDQDTEETTRTESLLSEQDQTNQNISTGNVTENNLQDNTQKTTGTVTDETNQNTQQDSTTNITNTSDISTGVNHNVNFSHNIPEQSIDGTTGQFPLGEDGIPALKTSYVQNASEAYASSTPTENAETSEQLVNAIGVTDNTATQTNDLTVTDTGEGSRTAISSGTDNAESKIKNIGNNTITEKRTLNATNKQYAYEVSAFLTSAGAIVAFSNWEDRFDWVVGIL